MCDCSHLVSAPVGACACLCDCRTHLDTPFNRYNCDATLSGYFKEAFGKRFTKADMKEYTPMRANSAPADVDLDTAPGPDLTLLASTADRFGTLVQYNSPGFLRNWRQYRQFGCAVMHIAQVRVCTAVLSGCILSPLHCGILDGRHAVSTGKQETGSKCPTHAARCLRLCSLHGRTPVRCILALASKWSSRLTLRAHSADPPCVLLEGHGRYRGVVASSVGTVRPSVVD